MTEREIFVGAFGRTDPADQDQYLAEACGPDVALRRRVERLLGLVADTDDFLDTPPVGPGRDAAPDTGLIAGAGVARRDRVVEVSGEGGMGAVWLAEQEEPVRRSVALKVLRSGMDSRQVVLRFEAERQALARMDHPNIATVLDAGTASPAGHGGGSVPFFVM